MRGLITDRSQQNVDRLNALKAIGWEKMTDAEKAEWSGNPLLFSGANLMPYGPNYSSGVEITYENDSIVATAVWDGSYIFAVSVIGPAEDFTGKTLTLSAESIVASTGAAPQLLLYWHDDNGSEYAGGPLTAAGSTTFTLAENTSNRAYLAMYIYVASETAVTAGAIVRYGKVMLEAGSVAHEYVPYYEVIPTAATKGGYNYSDLNRVERVVAELSNMYGLGLVTKTDWTKWDIPKQADMDRYISNISSIRSYFGITNVQSLTMGKLNFTRANNFERILNEALEIADAAYRAGELYLGEA